MSLLDVLRAGVKVADTVTKPLQGQVEYHRYTGQSGTGVRTYTPPLGTRTVLLDAIIDLTQKSVKSFSGELEVCNAMVMFLNVAQVADATNDNGIGADDVLILPNGQTGPILTLQGFMDAGTSQPIATEVYLG